MTPDRHGCPVPEPMRDESLVECGPVNPKDLRATAVPL